jgi:hypothetical protein
MNIAQNKFAVLHSSYWGRGYHPWAGLYRDLRLLHEPLQIVELPARDVDQLRRLAERVRPGSIDNINTLAPLLPHAYAPVPRPSRPQPRTPPP